jgi:hypothetical protein
VNDLLAQARVVSTLPLSVTYSDTLVKLAVLFRKATKKSFAGPVPMQWDYRTYSSVLSGLKVSVLTPHEGASPFIGSIGTREYAEGRGSSAAPQGGCRRALAALSAAHPYEPAVDLYPLLNNGVRKGWQDRDLKQPLSLEQFVSHSRMSLP